MYVTFELVNDGVVDYPENIKCFNNKEDAEKYKKESSKTSIIIEEALDADRDFETYKYLDLTYRMGCKPQIEFKTTTSLDKKKEDINSIHSFGDVVYVDMVIENENDGHEKIPKILNALRVLFFNLREDEQSIIHHKIGIIDIDKEEFFNMID